ncbi:CWF19-like protein 2 isoform X2 [Tachyglossus aculeatus]|uniref:CWF19-like protein 2 isoform X2 n=1 Tax=Tachyglossus aculeatus TaxID=9261 RepID=UPI0018F47546|nr:CWF19-like protein 2 isoform X2 [Tachyglossus aculeatus]
MEEQKEQRRQAKTNYEKEERSQELKRLRGEDTWMLADVNERVEQLSQEHSLKKKKKKDKHSKKVKKEKKKKKKQKSEKNDSTDSSSDSEEEWVESAPLQGAGPEKAWKVKREQSAITEESGVVQRDEWMTLDFMSMKTVSAASLKAEKQAEKKMEQEKAQAVEQSRLLERELNPYWKDGGTGLPPEEHVSSMAKVTVVEDGGLSWLRKSYQRMKEQAEKQNRSFEDVVTERYGSMATFQSKLEEAEKAASKTHEFRRDRWRKPREGDPSGWEKQERSPENHGRGDTKRNNTSRDYSGDRDNRIYVAKDRTGGRDRSRGDERDYKSEPTDSYRKESYHLNQRDANSRRDEVTSLRNLKLKFLKPSNDEESALHSGSRGPKPHDARTLSAQSALRSGFRKPSANSEETSPARSLTEGRKERQSPDQKIFSSNRDVDSRGEIPKEARQKSEGENLRGIPEKRESSLDTKPSLPGTSEDEPMHVLTEDEMNRLGAKIVKAELMGNMDLALQLKDQLEKARRLRESGKQVPSRKPDAEDEAHEEASEVVLVRTDQSGRAWPVSSPGEPLEPKGGRRKRQMATTHADEERVRYFHNDDHQSLKDLVKNEKMGTAEDQNKLFMRMASKLMEKTDREYYTLDDMFVSKAAKKERPGEEEERQRKKAIFEHQQLAAQMEKCPYCFDSPELPKHLIVAIGTKVYLCLPNHRSLTEGHCLIAPLQHHTAATLLDEDIWEEIQMFRKALVKMFEHRGLDCVFLETHTSMKKRYHMVYECIPLPKQVGDMAPIYFKKAILESDEEWSMNKKLIDLASRDIRKSVPKGLPYFSVDFGLQGGFAHVIEDQHKFPHYFGKEIIGGMLDLEPRLWRKGIRENFDDQRKKSLQFAQWWKPFDFTKNKE